MKITKQELVKFEACRGGLARFVNQTGGTDEAVEVSSLIGGLNTVSDLAWLAGKTLSKGEVLRFACDCALMNIDLIKPYTVRFEEIVAFLKAPHGGDADAAAYCAHAASCDAHAAYAAGDGIACDASYAAYAAYAAACAYTSSTSNIYADNAVYAVTDVVNAAINAADSCIEINDLMRELFK